MFKHILLLLTGIGFFISSSAQCYQNEVYKTARKGGNAIYLRDFNKKIEKNSSDSTTVDLNKKTLYRFIHYNNSTSYFELRDENNKLFRSTFAQDSNYPVFDFSPEKSSTYKLIFYNRTDRKICSLIIFSFVGKYSNFIGLSSDSSILTSGKHLDSSCQYADSLPDLLKYSNVTEVLDISFNNFQVLPPEINKFKHLKKLSLAANINLDANHTIKKFPNPDRIEVLDLSMLHFHEYPKELNRFSNLKSLSFVNTHFNKSTNITDVFLLESLENLSLNASHLRKKTIPKIAKSNLKTLSISGYYKYASIKHLLKALPKLEKLILTGYGLKDSKKKKLSKRYPNVTIIY